MNFQIRLAGSKSSNEGRLEVKAFGRWGGICDDQFDIRDANVSINWLGHQPGFIEFL